MVVRQHKGVRRDCPSVGKKESVLREVTQELAFE